MSELIVKLSNDQKVKLLLDNLTSPVWYPTTDFHKFNIAVNKDIVVDTRD